MTAPSKERLEEIRKFHEAYLREHPSLETSTTSELLAALDARDAEIAQLRSRLAQEKAKNARLRAALGHIKNNFPDPAVASELIAEHALASTDGAELLATIRRVLEYFENHEQYKPYVLGTIHHDSLTALRRAIGE